MKNVTRSLKVILFYLCFLAATLSPLSAEETEKPQLLIGFIGSLSSFAANYGRAVLMGAELAAKELREEGVDVKILVEDDQSVTRNAVTAYSKLSSTGNINALIAGTWWANAIVKLAERDNFLLLSCETLHNEDAVEGETYFLMPGDLKDWIRAYKPLVDKREWKRGAIIRYASGFGATLAGEMEVLFSSGNREFAGEIEYNEINLADASDIAIRLRRLNPDVVYVDAQPAGLANLLRKLDEAGLQHIAILTNPAAEDLKRENLFDLSAFPELYFTRRSTYDEDFAQRFRTAYKQEPFQHADLGYYSVYLLEQALKTREPLQVLRNGLEVRGKLFNFDDRNVHTGMAQEIYHLKDGEIVRWD